MDVAKNQRFKCEIVQAQLNKISSHDLYADFRELLATENFMLPSNDILTEQARDLSLLMHPIVVINSRKTNDRYYCIGGIRSLLLAQSTLALDAILSVTLVRLQNVSEIELAVKVDLLLSPLLMSIRSPATIGKIYQKMNKGEIRELLIEGMENKSKFSETIDFAKNTIFSPKSKSSVGTGRKL